MIKEDEVIRFGKLLKPHGLQGELSFNYALDVFDTEEDIPYFVCDMDGILVPFYIEDFSLSGVDSGYVKFEGVDSEEEAQRFKNVDLYIAKELYGDADDEDFASDSFVGYDIVDQYKNNIGKITDFIDSEANPLFVVQGSDGKEILIPAQDEFVIEINDDNKYLVLELPDGLLDIDAAENDFD